MDDEIKLENYSTERVCDGCLSSDRIITPLGELTELFYMLSRFPASNIFLCWECKGVLKKTWRFQQRLQRAQYLLQQATLQLRSPKELTLSTLGTVFNGKYETVHENNYIKEDLKQTQFKTEPEAPDRTKPEDVKEEVYDEGGDDSDFEQASEDFHKVEETNGENNKIEVAPDKLCLNINNKETRSNDRRRCKYLKHAVVTENVFSDTIDNYYIKSFLCEEVIKELLNRRLSVKQKKSARFRCKICDVGFYKIIDWKRHNIIKHPPKEGPYRCCECDPIVDLPTISDLKAHWTTHEIFRCKKCGEPFRSEEELSIHLRMIHSFKYCCIDCDGSFHSHHDFLRHYKELHVKMTCDYCKKTFTRKKILETHIKRAHLPPVCAVCGRSYRTFHALDAHGRLNHPELYYDVTKTELSYCVECNKQFNSVYTYKRHLATAFVHRPPKPVRIPCPDCGKVFSRKVYMNNHYRLFHVKKSKHHCEICDKYYVTAYALRSHKQRIHEKTYPPKNKICDICGRGFSTNRVLTNHRRTHTGERPFKCSQCPAAFAQKCAKKSHERSQHKIF